MFVYNSIEQSKKRDAENIRVGFAFRLKSGDLNIENTNAEDVKLHQKKKNFLIM
jgi:hypothetical protein